MFFYLGSRVKCLESKDYRVWESSCIRRSFASGFGFGFSAVVAHSSPPNLLCAGVFRFVFTELNGDWVDDCQGDCMPHVLQS